MTNEPQNPDVNPEQQPEDFETEFHYPAGKLEEEVVRDPHGGWAPKDFDSEDFNYEFDESEFSEADFGEDETGFDDETPLSEEEWEALSTPLVSVRIIRRKTFARWPWWAARTWVSLPW